MVIQRERSRIGLEADREAAMGVELQGAADAKGVGRAGPGRRCARGPRGEPDHGGGGEKDLVHHSRPSGGPPEAGPPWRRDGARYCGFSRLSVSEVSS